MSTVQLKKDNIYFNGVTLTATVGDTVHLSCTPGFSRPNPTIDWYIGNVRMKSNSAEYAYTAEDSHHNKKIYCVAYIAQQTVKAESNKPTLYVNGKSCLSKP